MYFPNNSAIMIGQAKKNSKWIFLILLICLFPVFVNWIMTVPCEWTIEGPHTWIGFWGAYFGSIASFAMACIAWKQMCIISEQNRPQLYPTIEIFSYRDGDCNHFDYCLHIVNYGSRMASDIHIEIDGEVLSDKENKYLKCLSIIRDHVYDIPEKDDIVLKICPELSVDTVNDKNYTLWLDKFKQSTIKIKLTYNNEYIIEKNISLCNTLYAKTSSLQMLYYLKQSIDNLNETLKKRKGNYQKNNFATIWTQKQ